MGVLTNGQICYGNVYEEGFEFPWDAAPFDGDEEGWWRVECGYKPSQVLFDDKGNYLNGIKPSDEAVRAHFAEQQAFDDAHPLPVGLVNYCSGECPMWILAVPSTVRSNRRGYPRPFDPQELVVSSDEKKALYEFCVKYNLISDTDAGWYLTSYWG